MAGFRCPDCGSFHEIFGSGGGKALAEDQDLPFLGGVPLDPAVRTGGDEGEPVVLSDGETADAFRLIVENVASNAGIVRRREASSRRA